MKPALLILLLAASPADAEPISGATLSADLRAEYLAGSPLLVTIEARNETDQTITVPDLSVRHDLIRFEIRTPSGETQTRRTLVENPVDKKWSIPPRGKREVLLEVPSASTLKPGDYEVAVHFTLGETEHTLEPRSIRLSRPAPVAADLTVAALPSERAGDWTPWLHKAGENYDLYLHRTTTTDPTRTAAEDYLTRLGILTEPSLTAARPADASDRYVVWTEGARTIGLARLQGHRLRAAPQSLDAPWPAVSLAARGATGSDGRLYQPLWIPAPRGTAGEIRVLVAEMDGQATYRKLGRYDQRPDLVRTVVTDAGSALFLLTTDGHLDLYTVQPADTRAKQESLPVPGDRLLSADPGAVVRDVRFTILPSTASFAGGLAMMGLFATAEGLQPRWMGLSGVPITTGSHITLPEGATVVDVSPNGLSAPGLLLRLKGGSLRYQEGGFYQDLGRIQGDVALDRSEGTALLRTISKPIGAVLLQPTTPLVP
jgi:hypothetical protein